MRGVFKSSLVALALLFEPCQSFLGLNPLSTSGSSGRRQESQCRPSAATAPSAGAGAPQAARYNALWDAVLKTLNDRLPDLQPYEFPADLKVQEGIMPMKDKKASVVAKGFGYRLPGVIRQARALVMTTEDAPSPQVINFVIFPEPHLSLPIFGADLVTLPGGDLVALDFQPMGDMDDAYMSTYYTTLRGVYDAARASLPPGGGEIPEAAAAFFSPMHLFGRVAHDAPDLAGTQKACDDAFMGYLHAYLDLIVAGAGGEKVDAKEVAARQGAYSRYRYEKDPARGMLKRLFGEEYTEHVLKDFLFDLVKLDE